MTLGTKGGRRAVPRRLVTGPEEPPWPWWLREDEHDWLRWQIRQVAHGLLAEAVEGLAYHLASWSWPDQVSAIGPWLRRTIERWPLPETGGTLGRLCEQLRLPLWERLRVRAVRDLDLMGPRIDAILEGAFDVDEVCARGERVAIDAAVEQLRMTCWRPEMENRVEVEVTGFGGDGRRVRWCSAESRVLERPQGRPELRLWPILHKVDLWIRRRHRGWNRELDGRMTWKLVAGHLVYVGCGDDVARLADSLRHGLVRWRRRHGLDVSRCHLRSQAEDQS